MTKTALFLSFGLLFLIFAGVILSFLAPEKISLTNSIWIRASAPEVYDQLRFMKNFPNWSPFKATDPEQTYTLSGKDGDIGATYSWVGVKEKSRGSQSIVSLKDGEQITLQCHIIEPFVSSPTFTYQLVEKDGGIEVHQNFEVKMSVTTRVLALIFGVKSTIHKTNQHGLVLLKSVCEKINPNVPLTKPQEP